MDTTDREIQFDEDGICNHCKQYQEVTRRYLRLDPTGQEEFQQLVLEMKEAGRGRPYDCLIGVSGGVDSTYVACTVRKLGLRPLAVHLDNGWDSELAVSNIEKALKKLAIDLFTHVLNWEEFRDLQLSFLKASVPDAEIPTDHAIGAVMFQTAVERGIPYVLSGSNLATEGILPASWTYGIWDWRYIRGVHRQFGRIPLKTFPHYNLFRLATSSIFKRIKRVRILNYVPYNREKALRILKDDLDWNYYGGKHYESIYTRFFQGYILPTKFNIDKRKAHLSTLICAGQMTRQEALEEMRHNPYTDQQQREDKEYVIKKLGITEAEFGAIMALPIRSSYDYPTSRSLLGKARALAKVGKRIGILPRQITIDL